MQKADALSVEYETTGVPDSHKLELELMSRKLLQLLGQSILSKEVESDYDVDFLLNYYKSRPEFSSKALVPSYYISKGEYNLARLTLGDLESEELIHQEYVEAQHIYLDYLMAHQNSVEETKLNRLKTIGAKSGPLNGYARTILYLITGERLEFEIPAYDLPTVELRSGSPDGAVIAIYPNPTLSNVRVSITERESKVYKVTLVSAEGIELNRGSMLSNHVYELESNAFPTGIAVLSITDEAGEIFHTEKIVILE